MNSEKLPKLVRGDLVKANGAAGIYQGGSKDAHGYVLLKSDAKGFNVQEFHLRQIVFVKKGEDLG